MILPRDFTMEQDEVTPTLKLKRRAIMQNFADAVDGLYASVVGRDVPARGRCGVSAER